MLEGLIFKYPLHTFSPPHSPVRMFPLFPSYKWPYFQLADGLMPAGVTDDNDDDTKEAL